MTRSRSILTVLRRQLFGCVVLVNIACLPNTGYYSYSTVPEPPGRDTRAAQRLNTEGLAAIETNDSEAAAELFRAALEKDLLYAPAHNNLGLALLSQGRVYEAAWEFQFAAKLVPNSAEPRHNLGLVLERVGQVDSAIDQYEKALLINPNDLATMGHLARAQIKSHQDSPELRERLRRLSFQDPNGDWDRWARGQLLRLNAHQD